MMNAAVRLILCAWLTLWASVALAQSNFTTPGGAIVDGKVEMCLNTSSQAVPCNAAGVVAQPVSLPPFPANAATGVAATPITAASGNVAAGVATATLAGAAGKTTYICGFSITSSGSTAAAVVAPTIANTVTGTLTFTYVAVAGVTLANQSLIIPFNPCVPANAANTTIPVSMPSLGAGNTNTTVNAWGFQL